jgi:uncharacterized membrane protein (DUF373 family)
MADDGEAGTMTASPLAARSEIRSSKGDPVLADHDDVIRHWPPRRRVHGGTPRGMQPLVWAEDFLHYAVATVLLIAAFIVLIHSVRDALVEPAPFSQRVPALIDGVLFVIIVLEIFTTVLSHFRDGGLQLQPFLIIGIISAVRHILVVGARSSLGESVINFDHTMIELTVNVGIAIILVVALAIVNRSHPRVSRTKPNERP